MQSPWVCAGLWPLNLKQSLSMFPMKQSVNDWHSWGAAPQAPWLCAAKVLSELDEVQLILCSVA